MPIDIYFPRIQDPQRMERTSACQITVESDVKSDEYIRTCTDLPAEVPIKVGYYVCKF